MSTVLSKLNAFLDTELEQVICFDGSIDAELFVKTTYYEADPEEVTGLNTDAFRTVFDPDSAETAEEMMIEDWSGCLYHLPEKSCLCWTAAPDISYVMEYDPSVVSDADIIRMAESAVPIEPTE